MAETLTARVTRILAGSAHAFFDGIEDVAPEAMMRQAVRDIEEVVSEAHGDLGRVEVAKHLISSQINKLNSENEQLAGQIETALEHGEEGLARAGIERQVLIDDQTPVLKRALAEQQEQARELASYVTALLAKRCEMEEALQQYLATRARIEGAHAAFDGVPARQTGTTGLSARKVGDTEKLAELEALARNQRIDARLAALKARMAK